MATLNEIDSERERILLEAKASLEAGKPYYAKQADMLQTVWLIDNGYAVGSHQKDGRGFAYGYANANIRAITEKGETFLKRLEKGRRWLVPAIKWIATTIGGAIISKIIGFW